jgi:hypothetical protein
VSTQGTGSNSAAASKSSRLKGLLLLISGFVIGYFSIVLPLQEAYSNAPKISLYFKFAFLSPALICLGILAIIVPSTLTDQSFMSTGHNKLSVAGWALVIVLLIIGFGTYYLLDQQISSLGYK